jgi:hypothetical protein
MAPDGTPATPLSVIEVVPVANTETLLVLVIIEWACVATITVRRHLTNSVDREIVDVVAVGTERPDEPR